MEMKIKAELVKNLRQQRAWSQQHLADVAGTSLRTIQRIEKTGQSSPESTKGLAAAFGITANELIETVYEPSGKSWFGKLAISISALFGLMASLAFFVTTAIAEPVMLDVSINTDDQQVADFQLLAKMGEDAEVMLDNNWKIMLAPTITADGKVRIAAKVYQMTDTGVFSLVSSSVLITDYHLAAEVRHQGASGTSLNFAVTPK